MPTVITQSQDNYLIRSLDVPHINPSIMEGQFAVPALLGKRSAVPLERYSPVNLIAPSISGDFKIPSLLTCNPGVWDAAPSPDYLFQWRANGVDIDGQTSNTLTTYLELDTFTIDCVVTAVNNQGFETAVSNSILVEIVLPIRLEEQSYGIITGLNQEGQQDMNVFRTAVVSGMWVEDVLTMMGTTWPVISGLYVDDRLDLLDHTVYTTVGLGRDEALMNYDMDLYVTEFYEYVDSFTIPNNDAEQGLLNWTVQTGVLGIRTGSPSPANGTQYWFGGDVASTVAYQDITLPVAHEALVDSNDAFARLSWLQSSFDTRDQATVTLEFFDAASGILGSVTPYALFASAEQVWRRYSPDLIQIPPLTRTIRIYMRFNRTSGTNNDGYVDDIQLDLWQNINAS